MTGHEALQHMRRAGSAPVAVTLIDGDSWASKDWPTAFPRFPHISIRRDDQLHSLDLRCLVGLQVDVTSDSADRLGALLRRVRDEKPRRLIGTLYAETTAAADPELLAVYDSAGELTWRKS